MIKGRLVEINQAIKRNGEVPEDLKTKSLKKLFIGGLPAEANREHLAEHFSKFGEVSNAYIIYDPITKESKCRSDLTKISVTLSLRALSRP
jgi:RNA recognition motif-containing protein